MALKQADILKFTHSGGSFYFFKPLFWRRKAPFYSICRAQAEKKSLQMELSEFRRIIWEIMEFTCPPFPLWRASKNTHNTDFTHCAHIIYLKYVYCKALIGGSCYLIRTSSPQSVCEWERTELWQVRNDLISQLIAHTCKPFTPVLPSALEVFVVVCLFMGI